jgi:hypothetical protein
MKSTKQARYIHTRLSHMAVILYILSGMCAAMGALAFIQHQFNEASIMYIGTVCGIGIAALLDRRRV